MSDWFNESASGGAVDVVAFFDSSVPELLAEVVSLGVLVSVSRTRDGGAIGITVTRDGQFRREYFRESGAAADWLLGARTALSGHNGQGVAPIASAGPRRPRKRS